MQLIVVVSIHQPSTAVFNLFDKLLLLSAGKTHYFGRVSDVGRHYESIGHELPLHVNPAEFLLELVNIDFSQNRDSASDQLDDLHKAWTASPGSGDLTAAVDEVSRNGDRTVTLERAEKKPSMPSVILTLLHRSFIKSYRDVFVYGIRFAMYIGKPTLHPATWNNTHETQVSR
jgi:ABC-type multidrug transport system ATPase subunit